MSDTTEAGIAIESNFTEYLSPNDPIINFCWQLKKNGKADKTIETIGRRLKQMSKLCDINNPEQVKAIIATQKWNNNTKHTVCQIYKAYAKANNLTFIEPRYRPERPIPFIPTEAEIDSLISASQKKTATLYQILKETGARIGELEKLEWQHIDNERKTIYITGEKGSDSRILPISPKLQAMLNALPKTTTLNNKVFQQTTHGHRVTFQKLRDRTAIKLQNPRLRQIHFHTFRHWKATMKYHKTKDIIHVKTVLGHRDIESTMVYINIEQALFLEQNDQFTCKATKDSNEATKLIEVGFEYIATTPDQLMLFKKRK